MKDKLQCRICDKILFSDERLEAQHPFISEDKVFGCPHCKDLEGFIVLCEIDGCDSPVSGGTPTEDGYKYLCYQHLQKYL